MSSGMTEEMIETRADLVFTVCLHLFPLLQRNLNVHIAKDICRILKSSFQTSQQIKVFFVLRLCLLLGSGKKKNHHE